MVRLPEPLTTELQPPAPLALVTAPPGVGKTHAAIAALGATGARAVYAAPTHELAMQVQHNLQEMGVKTHYWRQGPDDRDACPQRDMVEFFRALGYIIRWGPCKDCFKRKKCAYRKVFTCRANRSAQVLIITSWHLRRDDLWDTKALENRPLVILDEDALSALAAPVELTVERLRSFIENLQSLRSALGGDDDPAVAWLMRRLNKPVEGEPAALAMTDILRRAAENLLRACATGGHGQWRMSEMMLDQIMTDYDRALLNDGDVLASVVRSAYDVAGRRTTLPNILSDLRELLLGPRPVHISVGACRWIRRSHIPTNRRVLMLDATAEATIVEGVTGRSVTVIDTPPVEQKAAIFQIMDKIGTRAGNRRDMERQDSWTVKLTTEVARKHKGRTLLCVTFKRDEDRLAELLDREHGEATVIHYGALRGLNSFENYDVGLIVGRPMPNEAQLQLLAVAAFGAGALDENLRSPPLEWQLNTGQIGPDIWQIRHQQYSDERWRGVWRHVVTGELMQAIGRLRPLTNDATIYVVTNEPLPPALDVTALYAAELFPEMASSARRTDFQQRLRHYIQTMEELKTAGKAPTNRAVCKKLGIKECNGFRYRKLAQELPRPP